VSVAQFVLGLALSTLGAFLVVRRHALAAKKASRGRTVAGPAGWAVMGGLFARAGLAQIAAALA
jgi:hypothetical protein